MQEARRRRRRHRLGGAALAIALLLCLGHLAMGYVNPNFTPKHIERDAKLICTCRVSAIAADGKSIEVTVLDKIKGKSPAKLTLSFSAALAGKDGKRRVAQAMACFKETGKKPFLFVSGKFQGREGGLIHVAAVWMRLHKDKAGSWQFDRIDSELAGTFNGGTDMLIAAMRFIHKFPDAAIMPVIGGVKWSEHIRLGKLPGSAALVQAVDVNADGKLDVFVGGSAGDRLFLGKGDCKFGKAVAMSSSSLAAAWADFDGDGRVDLASLGKTGLSVHFQKAAGKFTRAEVKLPAEVKTGYPSLHVIDLAADGRADLVAWTGGAAPVILCNQAGKGKFARVNLPTSKKRLDLGVPGPAVVADLDGDGTCDVLHVHQKGGRFFKGKRDGSFELLAAPSAAMGAGKWRRAYLADLDSDGRLDIWLVGGGFEPRLLQNRGGGKFEEVMRQTGEPGYNIKGGAGCGALGDYNNDTFVDMIAGYTRNEAQTFFNRGFRSFAIDGTMALREDDVTGSDKGQAAVLWADLDGNGSLELISALTAGSLYVSMTGIGEVEDPACIRVTVSPKADFAGAVAMRFYLEGRCMGTRIADRWSGSALLSVASPGEYQVRYALPDGKEYARNIEVEDGAAKLVIGTADKRYKPTRIK
jgi:FG-GAP-like repeat